MERSYWIYIMASQRNGTLYIGVTNDLYRRVFEHRVGLVPGFTKRHACKILVHYELFHDVNAAIHREKRLKKWNRQWKLDLIQKHNLLWDDLAETLNA